MQTQTMFRKEFSTCKNGEQIWSNSALNTMTVSMPKISPEVLEKSNIITQELWTTLFLSMPRLEFCKDFDIIYNSS